MTLRADELILRIHTANVYQEVTYERFDWKPFLDIDEPLEVV